MHTALAVACLVAAYPSASAAAEGQRYVPPITAFIFNESPYITTEIRPFFLYHKIPDEFVTTGGSVTAVGAQLRLAVTDRLALIATKDGYVDIDFDAALPDEDGWANLAFGAKYAVIADPEEETFVTVGARYELPSGDLNSGGLSIQGDGDGFIDVFVTGATMVSERAGIQGSLGVDMALDNDHDSSFLHASVHGNYEVTEGFFGVVEANVVSTVDDGTRTDSAVVGSFEGVDVFNFGNNDSGTVATAAFGARLRITDSVMLGLAYEFPVTGREDIFDDRVTTDAVITF